MKMAIALTLLFSLGVGLSAHADNGPITRSQWIIVLTFTDRATGELIEEHELDAELEFDDPRKCESVVAKAIPTIPLSASFVTGLTCRKVERT
jgi:hypothetical protein